MVTLDKLKGEESIETLTWRAANLGDHIIGKCLKCDFSTRTTYGIKLLIVIQADEVVSGGQELPADEYVIWGKAHLNQTVLAKKLCAGDNVGIFFEREEPSKFGNPKKKFLVSVEKTAESEKWVVPIIDVNMVKANADEEATGVNRDYLDAVNESGA